MVCAIVGSGDLDRLEAPLEGGVLLEVLAVLVERGGTDRLQLTARQHRLEDRGGVDRALGGTGTDERVQLVDEQDDVAAGLDLLEHLLQALLEVTAVARAGDQGAQVEAVDLLVLERLRDVAADDRLGETLDAGGLAHAGLSDEHRVVLGAAGEHLHHALDLLLAPDHRVELPLARGLRVVAAELVEDQRGGRGAFLGSAGGGGLLALEAGEQLDDLLADPVEVGAELDQHLGGDALALTDQAEQDVLGADVVVAELQRLAERQLEDLLGARRERDVPARRLLALADDLLDLRAHGLERDAQALERLRGDALTLVDQAQEDVLGADVVVAEHPGFFLRQDDHPAGSVCEPLEHVSSLLARLRRVWRSHLTCPWIETLVLHVRGCLWPRCTGLHGTSWSTPRPPYVFRNGPGNAFADSEQAPAGRAEVRRSVRGGVRLADLGGDAAPLGDLPAVLARPGADLRRRTGRPRRRRPWCRRRGPCGGGRRCAGRGRCRATARCAAPRRASRSGRSRSPRRRERRRPSPRRRCRRGRRREQR